jgi:hypothetical protein
MFTAGSSYCGRPFGKATEEQAVTWLLHLDTGTDGVGYDRLDGVLEAPGLLWLPFHVYLTDDSPCGTFIYTPVSARLDFVIRISHHTDGKSKPMTIL